MSTTTLDTIRTAVAPLPTFDELHQGAATASTLRRIFDDRTRVLGRGGDLRRAGERLETFTISRYAIVIARENDDAPKARDRSGAEFVIDPVKPGRLGFDVEQDVERVACAEGAKGIVAGARVFVVTRHSVSAATRGHGSGKTHARLRDALGAESYGRLVFVMNSMADLAAYMEARGSFVFATTADGVHR